MTGMKERLAAREKPIACAVVGIGSIGKGLAYQCHITPGFALLAIADIDLQKAIDAAEWMGRPYQVVETEAARDAAIASGKLAVAGDGSLISDCAGADVLIEASNAVYQGALHARRAIAAGQHVVMMNYETEMMYGPALLRDARAANVVYTCADGDQPTVIKRIVDDISFWGFDLVMLGNMKGFHDLYTNPTKIAPEADKRNLDHKMCASYTDGSKLCVEMGALANALGGRTHVPGMHGPCMDSIHDIFDHFDFAGMWAPGDPPLVDYVLGARPKGGVFAIGHTADPFQQFTLDWFPPDMGPGPFYLFYRPYHLGHIEALHCVAEAVLDGTARLAPEAGMCTNVFCYAKHDLQPGDRLDGMGGYNTYGLLENIAPGEGDALSEPAMPQLITDAMAVTVTRPIAKDTRIPLEACHFDRANPAWTLWQEALTL